MVDFGVPLESQNIPFGPTFGRLSWFFGVLLGHMWFFCAPGCSGRVPGAISGVWGSPGKDFGRNLNDFLHHSGGSWRPSFVPTSSQVWPHFRSVSVAPPVLPLSRAAHKLKGRRARGAF